MIMTDTRRIFAVVSEKDFYAFQRRARHEGLNMGQALCSLTHGYASGMGPALERYDPPEREVSGEPDPTG